VSFSVSAETGEIHVKNTGTLSGSVDTDIEIHADGSSSDYAVGATYGRNAVWSDYEFVSHDGGGTDSSGNITPTANGGVIAGAATGKIGSATEYDGSGDLFNLGDFFDPSTVTVSVWYNFDVVTSISSLVVKSLDPGATSPRICPFWLSYNTNDWSGIGWGYYNSSAWVSAFSTITLSTGTWYAAHSTYDGADMRYYHNGVLADTTPLASYLSNNRSWGVGGAPAWSGAANAFFTNGKIDEVRIKSGANSDNTIDTEYENQNSPTTFYSVAAEGGGSPAQNSAFLMFM